MWADKAQLKMKELMKKARKVLAGWKGNSYVFGEGVLNPQLKEIQQQKETILGEGGLRANLNRQHFFAALLAAVQSPP